MLLLFAPLERCQSGRMGRIRNPLYLHRYLGFESLSLRHYMKTFVNQRVTKVQKQRFVAAVCSNLLPYCSDQIAVFFVCRSRPQKSLTSKRG
ncbi:permease component II [Pseudomonas syringae pv. actinidiae]|uniref:Permease component II n=1 Tax=Pseudomonas syringae pv. actinidiae TaxID=103796 RepID=A0AAN4Q2Q0_PSESF|nr:permease component II [Pseudomonas syringae pv. actinidiae]